jgi:hypothetical protein
MVRFGSEQRTVCQRDELVSGENRDSRVPPLVHGRLSAAQTGMIHHVVMHEREIVQDLDRGCGVPSPGRSSTNRLAGDEDQDRPDALPAAGDDIAYRLIERIGFPSSGQEAQPLIDLPLVRIVHPLEMILVHRFSDHVRMMTCWDGSRFQFVYNKK